MKNYSSPNQQRNSFFEIVFPIKSNELIKFIPMALLIFVVLLNQNITRGIKDSLVMTLIGPEIISFIKLFIEMPTGVLFVLIYAKMCNMVSTEKAFRYVVYFFLIYFFAFGFLIFPNIESLHVDKEVVDKYTLLFPNLKWFIVLISKWSIVSFYVMGELWPIIIFCLLFWQLANKITSIEEAKRFYPLFSLFGHMNLLFSGQIIVYFAGNSHILSCIFDGGCQSEATIKSLTSVVLISGLIIILIHRFIEKQMRIKPEFFLTKNSKETLELTISESVKMILSSRYLGMICIICMSYHVCINLIEGVWFSKAKQMYSTTEAFMGYQGKALFYTGLFTIIACFCGSFIVKTFGWFFGAVATPMMLLLNGVIFFLSVMFQNYLSEFYEPASVLAFIVLMGALQNVIGRGTKYSLYDSTKEMLYIPLSNEMKAKGKAAADIIGTKVGKSIGAIIQSVAFIIMPNAKLEDITGFLTAMYILICVIWIYDLWVINKTMDRFNHEHKIIDK